MTFNLDAALAMVRERARSHGNGPKALLLPHDNPDPDSLAAALGMSKLLGREGIECTIVHASRHIVVVTQSMADPRIM